MKRTKYRPQSPNFRIVDLGLCSAAVCPDFSITQPHRHAFAFTFGKATLEAISAISKTLKSLGYSGELSAEQIPIKSFQRAYGYLL